MLITFALVQATPAHIYKSFPPEHKVKALSEKKTVPPVTEAAAPVQAETTVAAQPAAEPVDPGAYAASVLDSTQYGCITALWTGESGWNVYATNRSSGAYGIPQALPAAKMATAGDDWQTNGVTQVKWGLSYISNRYGTPCNAYYAWLNRSPHWY